MALSMKILEMPASVDTHTHRHTQTHNTDKGSSSTQGENISNALISKVDCSKLCCSICKAWQKVFKISLNIKNQQTKWPYSICLNLFVLKH